MTTAQLLGATVYVYLSSPTVWTIHYQDTGASVAEWNSDATTYPCPVTSPSPSYWSKDVDEFGTGGLVAISNIYTGTSGWSGYSGKSGTSGSARPARLVVAAAVAYRVRRALVVQAA
jgi:hypothetical protein